MAKLSTMNGGHLPVFFNIDQNVGERCPNLPEDVALVSFLLRASANAPVLGPKTKAICMNVKITETCTPELIQSIKDYEAAWPGTAIDAHISVVPANTLRYASGGTRTHTFILAAINDDVRLGFPRIWPRIDLIQGAPPKVIQLVKRVLTGS